MTHIQPGARRKKEPPGYWRAYNLLDRLEGSRTPAAVAENKDELIAYIARRAVCSTDSATRVVNKRGQWLPEIWQRTKAQVEAAADEALAAKEAKRLETVITKHRTAIREAHRGEQLAPSGLEGADLVVWIATTTGAPLKLVCEEVHKNEQRNTP